jgi:asparagine synthase (glutamine-hydrolysing)
MCGIIGYASFKGTEEMKWLVEARDMMKYRGPDNAGIWSSGDSSIIFGHRRLSIISTNVSSNQPLTYSHNNFEYVITYNGEIYNYKKIKSELISKGYEFTTESDTEVLLVSYVHWGRECVNLLEGMFSFVIYDPKIDKIFFARDNSGEKPFYYFLNKGRFYFSSEFLPLMSHETTKGEISKDAIFEYLHLGFLSEDKSFCRKIKKLPAGSLGFFDLRNEVLKVEQYFNIHEDSMKIESKDLALKKFDCLFKNSIENQLQSDVPVGLLLSGGIDSSLVSCIANSMKSDVTNFTVDFGDNNDELFNAKCISKYYGCRHEIINFNELGIDNFDEIISRVDEPISDSSFIPTFLLSEYISQLGGYGYTFIIPELICLYALYLGDISTIKDKNIGGLIPDMKNLSDSAYTYILDTWLRVISKYTHFIYFPIEFESVDDGVRSVNEEWRRKIDERFKLELEKSARVAYLTVSGSPMQRVDQILNFIK